MSKQIQTLPFSFVAQKHCNPNDHQPFSLISDVAVIDDDLSLDDLSLPPQIYSRLYEHQKSGVLWMYQCYLRKSGGLLGDG